LAYNGLNIGEGFTEFDRYNRVIQYIESSDEKMSEEQAIKLLDEVGIHDGSTDKLQWVGDIIYRHLKE